MSKLPVDIKAILSEATSIEDALQTPIAVSVYMDETAPGDVQALVRQAFASSSSHAQVSMVYFPGFPVIPVAGADIAVIVAGADENVGKYAEDMRTAGIPTMVVTSLPEVVLVLAEEAGHPIPREDVIGPVEYSHKKNKALPSSQVLANEPYTITEGFASVILHGMGEWIIEICKEKRLAFALAFSFVRRPLSLEAVSATSIQNGAIGVVMFIPGADMPIMTLNQAKMLLQIAAAYGQPMSVDRVKELAAVVGGAFACRSIARQVAGFVPGLGWAVKGGIGYAGTCAMGHAAIEYFEGGGNVNGLMNVVSKARDAVLGVADKASSKKGAHAVTQVVGSAASSVASKAVPAVTQVAAAAADAASSMGVVPESAAKATRSLGNEVTRHFKNK